MRGVHLPATGPGPEDEDWQDMVPADVLKGNWLLHIGGIKLYPPLDVINQYLGRGVDDHGMSGGMMWDPCSISMDNYAEYVESVGGRIARIDEIPADIETVEHWYMYRNEVIYSVPYEGQRKFSNEIEKLRELQREAGERDDDDLFSELYWQERRLQSESAEYVTAHLKRPER